MKIEMTNKKEANCKVKEMTSSVTKRQNKTEMAFGLNRCQNLQFYEFLMTRYLNIRY